MKASELNTEFYSKNKDICDVEYQKVLDILEKANLQGLTSKDIQVVALDGIINNIINRLQEDEYTVLNVFNSSSGKDFTVSWRVY